MPVPDVMRRADCSTIDHLLIEHESFDLHAREMMVVRIVLNTRLKIL